MTTERHSAEGEFEYAPSYEQKEKLELLKSVIVSLQEKGVKFAVAGGYGLDALYGSLTRNHKDYDFVVFDESEEDFREAASALGFEHTYTKESGTVVFGHNELGVELEYMPASKILDFLQGVGATDVDLESGGMLLNGELDGVVVPTFGLDTYRMFDSLQNERFENPDPHTSHKDKVYVAIEGRATSNTEGM